MAYGMHWQELLWRGLDSTEGKDEGLEEFSSMIWMTEKQRKFLLSQQVLSTVCVSDVDLQFSTNQLAYFMKLIRFLSCRMCKFCDSRLHSVGRETKGHAIHGRAEGLATNPKRSLCGVQSGEYLWTSLSLQHLRRVVAFSRPGMSSNSTVLSPGFIQTSSSFEFKSVDWWCFYDRYGRCTIEEQLLGWKQEAELRVYWCHCPWLLAGNMTM